jgi:soluble lytic murein transglycosylase
MKQKIIFFGMLIVITSLACNVERVFNPSPPTNTPAQPTDTPLPSPTPTATPIPTPEPGTRIENGDQAYFNGDWDAAILEYTQALESNSDSEIQVTALLGLGRSLHKAGDLALAKDSLLTAINTYPQSPLIPVIYFALGEVYESQGLYTEAANAFQDYYNLRPGLIDFYIQERIGDMWFAAKEFNNAIVAYQLALQAPYIGDTLNINVKIGDAYEALGDIATSLIIYEDVFNRTGDNREKALMKYYIGWAQITLGQTDQGYATYMEAVTQYPQYYGAYLALLKLIEAEQSIDWYTKGLVYYSSEQYGLAVDAFVRYLREYPDPHASAAHYYLGIAYQNLGNYEEAINQWQILIDTHYKEQFWAEAFEKIADTQYLNLRNPEASIKTYLDFVQIAPDYPEAPDYLYYAGRIAERSGNLKQAAILWERIGTDYSTSDKAYEGLFQAGIVHYRMREFDNAVVQFSSALGVASSTGEQAGAQFWTGKCYNELEEFQAAHSAWIQASTIDPTGYYSVRALEILNDQNPFTPPVNISFPANNIQTRNEADTWMHQTFNIPPEEDLNDYSLLLSDPRFIRGTELWNLGLFDEAKEEFTSLRLDIKINPANSYRLANYLIDIGLYYTGIQAAKDVLDSAGYDSAGSLSAPVYFSYIRFGTYYSDIVLPVTQEYNYDPLLFYSIMRRESLFESFITSSAGAGGLMQIWPPTGEAVYNQTKWPPNYSQEDLYRPLVSVKYGAYILDELRRRFNDNWYAILAGYHAGPDNASIWLSLAPDDPDLFVEVIRFSDTRDYIRWVYELHAIYKKLYEVS